MIETLEAANASEDPARRDELLTYVFVGGGYAGLEALAELQDFAADAMEQLPARPPARDALGPGRGRATGCCPRSTSSSPTTPLRELRGRGIDIRLGTTLEEVARRQRPALDRRDDADPDRRLDRRRRAASEPARARACRSTSAAGSRSTTTCGSQGMDAVWAIGDCAAAPDPRGGTCPPTAQHAVRQGPVAARNIAAELGIGTPRPFDYRSEAAFVNLGRYKAVGRIGDRTFRGFPAWWLARTYHMSQIPGTARKVRAVVDWTVGLPFGRDIAEVGSIGHPKRLG